MDIRYELSQLFEVAFGIKSPIYIPYGIRSKVEPIAVNLPSVIKTPGVEGYSFELNETQESSGVMSWMGTEVLNSVTFSAGVYKAYNHLGVLEDIRMDEFMFPFATLVEFSRAKNIVTTDVVGSVGTVKELISFSDWNIRIRGLCLTDLKRSKYQKFTEQEEQLIKWDSLASSIKVTGTEFSKRGIDYLVIDSINFPALEARPNVSAFEMSCKSDQPLELTIKI